MMLDLDDFKSINDQYGHPIGDAALIHFAMTLRQHVRQTDVVARLGGDEFALVLLRARGMAALSVLERLQNVLERSPLPVPGGFVCLRFSAGVTEWRDFESLAQALARADAVLLEAKCHGKAAIRLHPQSDIPVS